MQYGKKETASFDRRAVFWRFHGQKAVLRNNWKLDIINGKASLYNLSKDTGETVDVQAKNPDVFQALKDSLTLWEATLKGKIIVH